MLLIEVKQGKPNGFRRLLPNLGIRPHGKHVRRSSTGILVHVPWKRRRRAIESLIARLPVVPSSHQLSCQLSNVTLVEFCWKRFYPSMKAQIVKPVSVLVYLTFEPSRELAQRINEFSIEVLDASFNLALVLRIRRMSKLSLNTMLTTPVLQLILKLRAMIRPNSLRKPLLPL